MQLSQVNRVDERDVVRRMPVQAEHVKQDQFHNDDEHGFALFHFDTFAKAFLADTSETFNCIACCVFRHNSMTTGDRSDDNYERLMIGKIEVAPVAMHVKRHHICRNQSEIQKKKLGHPILPVAMHVKGHRVNQAVDRRNHL